MTSNPESVETPVPPKVVADSMAPALWAALAAGGLASACCVVPFGLFAVGLSGAWASGLSVLEPYRALFIAVAAGAMSLAAWRLWRTQSTPADGSVCTRNSFPGKKPVLVFAAVALLVVFLIAFPDLMPLLW